MTKDELKLKITAAYDDYLDKIEALGNDHAIMPPSPRQVQDDPRTHAAAAKLWAEFNTAQDRLNAEYFAPRDAAALRREKAEQTGKADAVREAQAEANLLDAEANRDREELRVIAMKAAGITVTDEEEAHIIETAQAQVAHCQEEVDRLKAKVDDERKDEGSMRQRVRPGSR